MKIYFESYGCTLSKSESALYVNGMMKDGDTIVQSPEDADISVIGTCVVIKHTEEKMLNRIDHLSTKSNVKVLGCLPTVTGKQISSDSIEMITPGEMRSFYTGKLDDIEIKEPSIFDGIPINQGCTGSCNYCISRIARGKLLSRKPEKIVSQVRLQLERGIREVRISSLDTAAYGKDLGTDLPSLVNAIISIDEDFMVRVGMMEPKNTMTILDPLIDSMKNAKVFKFLHVPVQSGDDRILELMNREYCAEDFVTIKSRFRESFPDSTLSTDIISGYHGEDMESFENTVRIIEKTRPDIINITRFSPRPYTPDFNKRTPHTNLVKRWTKVYTEMHREILSDKLSSIVGKVENIIITEKGKNGTWVGRDQAYRSVVVTGEQRLYSKVDAEIVDTGSTYLVGKVL
ncbi:tRNA (N(6)-L-threonylcarbamoyladenosine(37)-C(2))-methylthiotransferase [Oxyplasma meridianum]|uniref:tRNA-t(6)A37 methylthiotransferase n=1 Tax=Oxyplasma meridianum TaxID=3073602 RepID=A0AAX4NJ97_9ARCH